MSKNYFQLDDDMKLPDRWLLSDPVDAQGTKLRARPFMSGAPTHVDSRLRVPIYHPGTPLDFSIADTGGIPVVTEKVARVLKELAPGDIQLFPVEVESRSESYFLLNVTRLVKCINDELCSEVEYWMPEDERPQDTGQYRSVSDMRIHTDKVGEIKVFRPWGWTVALIVSKDIKQALEHTGATGLDFTEVTGPSALSHEEREHKRKAFELQDTPSDARDAVWRTLGVLDKRFLTPVAGCTTWPGLRQRWRVIHRDSQHDLLVSHGLSDTFISRMKPSVGFGLELCLETDAPLTSNEHSWHFLLLERVAHELALHEPLREQAKAGPISLEVPGQGLPAALVSSTGRVLVSLGEQSRTLPRQFPTPYGEVRLIAVNPLRPSK